ncbi:MAG: hypothetical protein H6Q89_1574 [Myxococcaceae bacterium]|nr:hypothetical protein [Myxococcaceae bacterium]
MQTKPFDGHAVGLPLAQLTEQPAPSQRQVALSLQVTVHAPVHDTLQSAELLQTTVVPLPTFSSQSELLSQTKLALEVLRSHFALLLQVTFAPVPTGPLQTAVPVQASSAFAPVNTLQVPEAHAHWVSVQLLQPAPSHTVPGGPAPLMTCAPQPLRPSSRPAQQRARRMAVTLARVAAKGYGKNRGC